MVTKLEGREKGKNQDICRKTEKSKTYFEHYESMFCIKLLVAKFFNRFYRTKRKRPAKLMSGLKLYDAKYN